jgi:hypothetical protein
MSGDEYPSGFSSDGGSECVGQELVINVTVEGVVVCGNGLLVLYQ